MATTATFNAGIDHFGMMAATSNALKVVSSNENRSIQSASGPNTYGDSIAVDSYGETAAPSSEYQVVGEIAHSLSSPIITLGGLIPAADSGISVGGTAVPVVVGSLSISTQNGSAPKITVNGQAVQAGAAQLRTYVPPQFTLSPRHRAQDFLGLCTIRRSNQETGSADPITNYGLESVNANFPIEFTLAQPKGVLMNYDLHGGTATVDYVMNWYVGTYAPKIVTVASVALNLGENVYAAPVAMTNPVGKSCPEGGYTQYTWQCSFPLVGEEYVAPTTSVSEGRGVEGGEGGEGDER